MALRAALERSLEDAAAAAGVSRRTALRFERYHRDVTPELIRALPAPGQKSHLIVFADKCERPADEHRLDPEQARAGAQASANDPKKADIMTVTVAFILSVSD